MKKTIYLIQEKGCLNPHSGAFQHISMGVKYLSKAFDLEIYLTTEKIKLKDYAQVKKSEYVHKQNTEIKGWGYGTLKDISILFLNGLKIPKLYKLFKTKKIDFVYERTSYLDFSGLIAARLAGIKHVYEANGLQYIARKKYYNSFFTPISKRLEKTAYAQSDFNFFIGTYGDFWQIKKQNWLNIENGIEKELLSGQLPNKSLSEKLQICFIGRPMKHQGLQLLSSLYKFKEVKQNTTLHFIGEGFDDIEDDLKALEADVINHGFKKRSDMKELIESFHIGLILDSPEYQSCMKLFDYAVGNLAVIAINNYNLKYWFQDELIFHEGSINSLKNKLEELIQNPEIMSTKSAILRKKIADKHTWDKVFEMEARVIKKIFQ